MSKIIQISVAGIDNNASTQANYIITALTADGEVYQIADVDNVWERLPDLPVEAV